MLRGRAPVAMMMLRAEIREIWPSGPVTSTALVAVMRAVPGDAIHAVLAEQEVDAAGHAVDDLPAALHRDAVVGAEVIELQAELIGTVDVGDDLGVFEESFGGNAAPIEAHTAQRFFFDDAGLETQLTGSYAGHIAAGPAANYCYVILRNGRHQSVRIGGLFERNAPCIWLAPLWRGLRADFGIIAAALDSGKLGRTEIGRPLQDEGTADFHGQSPFETYFRRVRTGGCDALPRVPRPCGATDDPCPVWGLSPRHIWRGLRGPRVDIR